MLGPVLGGRHAECVVCGVQALKERTRRAVEDGQEEDGVEDVDQWGWNEEGPS